MINKIKKSIFYRPNWLIDSNTPMQYRRDFDKKKRQIIEMNLVNFY